MWKFWKSIIFIAQPTSNISNLLDMFSFATWIIYFLTFSSIVVMRFRNGVKFHTSDDSRLQKKDFKINCAWHSHETFWWALIREPFKSKERPFRWLLLFKLSFSNLQVQNPTNINNIKEFGFRFQSSVQHLHFTWLLLQWLNIHQWLIW